MTIDIHTIMDYLRARGTRLTPYRLGLEVGRRGLEIQSPYDADSQADRLYQDGINHTKEQRNPAAE